MSKPENTATIAQILKYNERKNFVFEYQEWHTCEVKGTSRSGQASRWCNENLVKRWTFKVDFGQITFYIQDERDAMMFKLVWGGQ